MQRQRIEPTRMNNLHQEESRINNQHNIFSRLIGTSR